MGNERRQRCLVGSTIVDDLQGRLGQPERMREQSAIWVVEQPDLKLKCQIVERSQDVAVCRLPHGPMLHCSALGICIGRWDADGSEHRPQGVGEPLDEGMTIPSRHHNGQQTSLTDCEHNLSPVNSNQIGVPVAKDCVWRHRLRIWRGVEPVEELLGAAKDKHNA